MVSAYIDNDNLSEGEIDMLRSLLSKGTISKNQTIRSQYKNDE